MDRPTPWSAPPSGVNKPGGIRDLPGIHPKSSPFVESANYEMDSGAMR